MRTFVLLLIVAIASTTAAQDQKAPAKKKAAPNPAFEPVKDVAGLPRVLIIGDSISIGYPAGAARLLKGKANVHRPATNCGPTTRGVEQIEQWLAAIAPMAKMGRDPFQLWPARRAPLRR